MQAAKDAIHNFTSKKGHTTTVDEHVAPAVVQETVKPHRHEEVVQAVDREVHQDHHHTTVQPIAHQEVLPEKHTHNLVPTEHREIRHEDPNHSKAQVEADLAQFKPSSAVHQTTQSHEAKGAVAGEHVHHHVHETVVPVVHKETIQPEVVHTTVPIHETHHAASQHHGVSALPMKSLSEFQASGGVLDGHAKHAHEEYEGAPRPYNESLKTSIEKILPGHHGHSSTTGTTGSGLTGHNTTGTTGTGLGHNDHNTTGSGLTGHNTTGGLTGQSGSGLTGHNTSNPGYGQNTSSLGHDNRNVAGSGYDNKSSSDYDRRPDSGVGHDQHQSSGKPSLMDKLNPKVDSNGDGKAGFMK